MGHRIAVRDFVAQIGARVQFLRFERGLSMRELADLAGCSPVGIMQIEHGRAAMTLGTMRKLARALNVQPFDLLNHDTHTSDVGWFVETMRHDPKLVRRMRIKLVRRVLTMPARGAGARARRAARR